MAKHNAEKLKKLAQAGGGMDGLLKIKPKLIEGKYKIPVCLPMKEATFKQCLSKSGVK